MYLQNAKKLEQILALVVSCIVGNWRKEHMGRDPRIRIRTKMPGIRNTAYKYKDEFKKWMGKTLQMLSSPWPLSGQGEALPEQVLTYQT